MTTSRSSVALRSLVALATLALAACSDNPSAPNAPQRPPAQTPAQNAQETESFVITSEIFAPDSASLVAAVARAAGGNAAALPAPAAAESQPGLLAGAARASLVAGGCKSLTGTYSKFNILNQVVRQVSLNTHFCYSNGRVTSVYIDSKSHREQYLWNWVGWTGVDVDNYGTAAVSRATGVFKQCAAYCYYTDYMTVHITVYGSGAHNISKS